ncbi:DbpA RNA binding domain-containing protein [Spirochaeta lutea]|uniref:DbpA RNA binding domain-containing protein n=1 Tax=Spirochaeta lutea TaxID=1480694 RepID=UPI00055A0E75|nr:DbpA RNA binding domain-containing protein [Spirochaeta lutea]
MSKNASINEDALQAQLEGIIRDIQENEDPEEMNAYRAAFRKNVSFFNRSYVAAYLLKYAKGQRPSPRKSTRTDLVTLFVGIGKSRRVFPRDLVGLILEHCGGNKDDIGNIKILDNYSFVDIAPQYAEEIIAALNGTSYRGRNLNVNYAKKKD